jgi:hypothetical protein
MDAHRQVLFPLTIDEVVSILTKDSTPTSNPNSASITTQTQCTGPVSQSLPLDMAIFVRFHPVGKYSP